MDFKSLFRTFWQYYYNTKLCVNSNFFGTDAWNDTSETSVKHSVEESGNSVEESGQPSNIKFKLPVDGPYSR